MIKFKKSFLNYVTVLLECGIIYMLKTELPFNIYSFLNWECKIIYPKEWPEKFFKNNHSDSHDSFLRVPVFKEIW